MKPIYYILLILLFLSCSKNEISLTITNPSDFDRTSELVEIQLHELNNKLSLKDGKVYIVTSENGDVIPSQVTYDNQLIFPSGIKAKESKSFFITTGEKIEFETKAYAKHHPERYGDLAWENDRVGFRVYGKELKAIQAPTSGFDLWYKRTPKIVLDEWYRKELAKEASYHIDHGEGCDPYAVGQTLGAGNMAILHGDTILLNENYNNYEILDNGSLRTTVKLSYPSLQLGNNTIAEEKIISLEAGSQLSKIEQHFSSQESLHLVVGFPKRAKADSVVYKKGDNFFIYQEPKDEVNGEIFLGIIIPSGIEEVFTNKLTRVNNSDKVLENLPNVVAKTTYKNNEPIIYYTGFGWSKYGFPNLESFQDYINNYSKSLSEPLQISYK